MTTAIRPATPGDVATILGFVRELAAFEREPDAVAATEPMLAEALFGAHRAAEAVIAERDGVAVGFALFFRNFSTWTGRPGLYLEDLYVTPAARRRGGQGAADPSGGHRAGPGLGAVRMVGARLEHARRRILPCDGGAGDGRVDRAAGVRCGIGEASGAVGFPSLRSNGAKSKATERPFLTCRDCRPPSAFRILPP